MTNRERNTVDSCRAKVYRKQVERKMRLGKRQAHKATRRAIRLQDRESIARFA